MTNFLNFFPKRALDHAAWAFCFQQTDITTKESPRPAQFKSYKIWIALVYL
jgi:hypothetical protein